MTTQEPDIREQPAYGVVEAAHYLRIPVTTLRSWIVGTTYGTGTQRKFFKPVIHPAEKSPAILSFLNLIQSACAGCDSPPASGGHAKGSAIG